MDLIVIFCLMLGMGIVPAVVLAQRGAPWWVVAVLPVASALCFVGAILSGCRGHNDYGKGHGRADEEMTEAECDAYMDAYVER